MKFIDETTGEAVPSSEVPERAVASVASLRALLEEAQGFVARLADGALKDGDTFLDFTGPDEHGYDRTGPSVVRADEDRDPESPDVLDTGEGGEPPRRRQE